VFAFPLLKPIAKVDAKARAKADHGGLHAMDEAVNTASFTPFGQGLSGRRFSGYGLARRFARRRQADRGEQTCGRRFS